MNPTEMDNLATAYSRRGKALRDQGAVALAQRCDSVARNLRWAADEIAELAKRDVLVELEGR